MSEVSVGWRFIGAVSVAALMGSLGMATWSATDIWMADFSIFTPAETFRLTFVYALILSWPVVAVAMALFVPATNSILRARGRRRYILALLTGALGGMVVAIPVTLALMDGQIWAAVPIGLLYGLSSAAAGVLFMPNAGGESG